MLLPQSALAEPPHWDPSWRRVSLWEGLSLLPAGAALLLIVTQVKPPEQPRWHGGILFDSPLRDLVRGRSLQLQNDAAAISDALYLWGSAIPIVVDVGIVA